MPRRDPSDLFLEAFGRAIRERREREGLSQEDLALRADLDRTYVSGVERGVRNPTVRSILRIAEALGVQPSALWSRAERE